MLSNYYNCDQRNKINQLKSKLQHEKLKYKMLYRDAIVRKAIAAGGDHGLCSIRIFVVRCDYGHFSDHW